MSVLRLASVLTLSAVLSVAVATAAVAQDAPSTAPPGNSAVDQYRESLPPSSSEQRKLSRRDRQALERRGEDGAALASVLERTGGVPRAAASSAEAPDGASDQQRRRSDSGSDGEGSSGAGAGSGSGSAGGSPGTPSDGAPVATDSRPIAPAAASSTVGPVPIWAMLAAAAALVGVGLVVRARSTS